MKSITKSKRVAQRLLPALVASALTFGAASAEAVTFNGVYVFGDSLADAGIYRPVLLAAGVPAATAATLGRFTTNPGPVWSELVSSYYGGNPNPSNAGGGIYAQGGARVASTSTSTPTGFPQRPVTTQITEYLASTGGTANPNALYAIWAGGNDLLQAGAAGVASANDVAAQSARLRAAGARYIAVFGLPNLGLTPGARAGGAAAIALQTQASAGFNITLFNALAGTGQRVIPVDVFTMLNEVAGNAAAFGFTNITGTACGPFPPFAPAGTNAQFCTTGTLVAGATPTNYLFADNLHPTTGGHAIIADFVKSLIDGPNAYSTMAEVPLATRAAHVRTLDAGLRTGMTAAVGKVSAFAAGDGGKSDISLNGFSPATDSKNRSATAGVTFRASDTFTGGVAIGKTTADANMGGLGKFSTNESVLSAFGSVKGDALYLNFTASVAGIKFNNIQRNVKLGQVLRVNTASTKGTNASANVSVGYDFPLGKMTVGPFLSYTTQSVTVDGFTENAGATPLSTDLKISEQNRSSQVSGIGARASFDLGQWTPFARVSFEQENKRGERLVTASPVTITQNISYDIPGYRPGKSWGLATVGVRGNLSDRISASLIYSGTFSRTNVSEGGVAGSIAFQF